MKKILKQLIYVVFGCVFACPTFADNKPKRTEIIISAAASLTNAINELIAMYEKEVKDIKITPTYGASGTLRKQIEQGAPIDIFFSASKNHMDAIKKQGLANDSTVKDMLINKVVLIAPKDSKKNITSFADCATNKVTQIALGIPESVPAGSYAKQVFEHLKCYDAVKTKTVFAKDVRQVLNYVESGEVDVGAVYGTDAAISLKIKIICDAPNTSHSPIIYPACVLKESKHQDRAKAFLDYLSSNDAKSVFAKYGFELAK